MDQFFTLYHSSKELYSIDYNENEFESAFVPLKYLYTLSNSDFKNLDLLNICICVMGKYTEKEQQRLG